MKVIKAKAQEYGSPTRYWGVLSAVLVSILFTMAASGSWAVLSNSDFRSIPMNGDTNATPTVMLAMSVDHELFKKAYSDYANLDGGTLTMADTTYRNDFDYYGYFESDWCYTYASGLFTPSSAATNHTCSGKWSGNFLNWATMTRMDIVRRALYGGKRSTDSTTQTVLERAYLPADSHSFVKTYTGSDIGSYTPLTGTSGYSFCSTSHLDKTSVTAIAPYMRVAGGIHRQWALKESGIGQCQYSGSAPADADNAGDYTVRVEACSAEKTTSDRCSAYESADGTITYKPTGLLQKYGENGQVKFGLVSGSYGKNLEGGVLRKQASFIAHNTPGSTNALDEVNTANGVFLANAGIIQNISSFKLTSWDWDNYPSDQSAYGTYADCNIWNITLAEVKGQTISTKKCSNWGNPLSEIFLETLRYISGESAPTAAFTFADGLEPSGVTKVTDWTGLAPYSSDNWCASCSVIVLSTGLNSFDNDNLTKISDLPELASESDVHTKYTNVIGEIEQGGYKDTTTEFVGSYLSGGGTDNRCTAKSLTSLSGAEGVCPELPGQDGSYAIAGLAYYAHNTDLIPGEVVPGVQKVTTYAVNLAQNIPSFEIPLGTGQVSLLPFCESHPLDAFGNQTGDWQPCNILDVEVEFLRRDISTDKLIGGSYLVHWEDSQFGSDYDQDVTQRIKFCVGAECSSVDTVTYRGSTVVLSDFYKCPKGFPDPSEDSGYTGINTDCSDSVSDQLKVIVTMPILGPGNDIQVGYTITGTTNDGLKGLSTRRDGLTRNSPLLGADSSFPGNISIGQKGNLYSAGTSPAVLLERPLYYAAKYGSFDDQDGDGTPIYRRGSANSDTREWDSYDVHGLLGADGIPDNYFSVSNPLLLEQSMDRILSAIIGRVAAGTSATVAEGTNWGDSTLFQALYYPELDDGSNKVRWVGLLHGFFLDQYGNLREDTDGDAALDDCTVDHIVDIFYDTSIHPFGTRIRRYFITTADLCDDKDKIDLVASGTAVSGITTVKVPLEDLETIWSSTDQLAAVDPVQQRLYGDQINTTATGGRHLLSMNSAGVMVAFTTANFGATGDYEYLMVAQDEADDLVKFIRGVEGLPGKRNRTVDFGDGPTPRLLGDIVHSSPVVVAAPAAQYDVLYGDTSYYTFKEAYKSRRQMVYVGANDGMIHAFNGGFWTPSTKKYFPTGDGTEVQHPLGAELWGYIPQNLLPHLRWLASPTYEHVYYMDGVGHAFDVNIFTPSTLHPGGWGTILVMGMRLGGGELSFDTLNADNLTTTTHVMRSAYVILDITDPEQAPILLGEISHPDLGFTTSVPTLVKKRIRGVAGTWANPEVNEWSLVFGSGPDLNEYTEIDSDRTANLFMVDLEKLVAGTGDHLTTIPVEVGGTALPSTFAGNPTVVDWDGNYEDDVVYFGTVEGDAATATGRLMRYVLPTTTTNELGESVAVLAAMNVFFNPLKPFVSAPESRVDDNGREWLYAGSGRYFSPADLSSTSQQAFYGIKEPETTSPYSTSVTASSLYDATDIAVYKSGVIKNVNGDTVTAVSLDGGTTTVETFDELLIAQKATGGWYRNFEVPATGPSGRNITRAAQLGLSVNFSEFIPDSGASCSVGSSRIYSVHHKTGTAAVIDGESFKGFKAPSAVGEEAVLYTVHEGRLSDLSVTQSGVVSQDEFGGTNQDDINNIFAVLTGRTSWRQIFDIPVPAE